MILYKGHVQHFYDIDLKPVIVNNNTILETSSRLLSKLLQFKDHYSFDKLSDTIFAQKFFYLRLIPRAKPLQSSGVFLYPTLITSTGRMFSKTFFQKDTTIPVTEKVFELIKQEWRTYTYFNANSMMEKVASQ